MKKIKKGVWCFILALTFASCDQTELPNFGQFNVLQSGETWGTHYDRSQKTIRAHYYPPSSSCSAYYSIAFELFDKDKLLREGFGLTITALPTEVIGFKALTIYSFESNWCESTQRVFSGFSTSHGDVGIDYYRVLESEDNILIIESINQEKLEMKGTFNVTFVIDRRSGSSTLLPDTVRFTKGTFQTRISEN